MPTLCCPEPIQIHIRHTRGIRAMRVFMVSCQRAVAKTETEVHEGCRDKIERIPKGIPS